MSRDLTAPALLAAFALSAILVAPGARAEPSELESSRWRPPPASGAPSIVLYADTNLRGQSVELTGPEPNFNTIAFNDRARSVEVRGGVWLLCSNANFGGRCEYVDCTTRNLGDLGLSGNVSSAQVTAYDQGPRSYDIAFFADADFRGPFLGFNEGEATLSQFRFNDTASSVLITRGAWLVCEDADYRGRCELLDASLSDLGVVGLNDRISSFRRYDIRREGPWRPPVAPLPPPGRPGYGSGQDAFEGETTVFFPAPVDGRGRRIENREGAATRFCQEQGLSDAVYKARGRVLSDVLCR